MWKRLLVSGLRRAILWMFRESLASSFRRCHQRRDTQLHEVDGLYGFERLLAYSMKCETSKIASLEGLYVPIRIEDNAGKRKDEKFKSLLGALEKFWRYFAAGRRAPLDGTECDLVEVL
ncbi:hypothetical protein AVEN_15627-1 [Araneus ventricosus]|uniref:Uncharacterized protein n=1 Tax=Araneus ventricosus TaxID=182803 RepID=A0A4Y2KQH9_ARAVE|nr:hypothetical protein AVEN_15627-1 [Araneus ventricosus]